MLHDTIHLLIEDTSYVEKCSLDEKVLNAQKAGYEAVMLLFIILIKKRMSLY